MDVSKLALGKKKTQNTINQTEALAGSWRMLPQ